MLISPPAGKAYIMIAPIDFRKGIDGLVAIAAQRMQKDPRSGAAFVFRNKKRNSVKVLYYDEQGYWLCQKRFSEGRLKNWPALLESGMSLAVKGSRA